MCWFKLQFQTVVKAFHPATNGSQLEQNQAISPIITEALKLPASLHIHLCRALPFWCMFFQHSSRSNKAVVDITRSLIFPQVEAATMHYLHHTSHSDNNYSFTKPESRETERGNYWSVTLEMLQQRILVFYVCYCWSVINDVILVCDVINHTPTNMKYQYSLLENLRVTHLRWWLFLLSSFLLSDQAEKCASCHGMQLY